MNAETFDAFLEETLDRTREVLRSKGHEYAHDPDESRFHNFEVTAQFLDCSEERALWGFMAKHLTSVNDMIKTSKDNQYVVYPLEQWDEKIGDVINYMILLRGIVHHRASLVCTCPDPAEVPLEDHVVVVTNDDPEIHILPDPTDEQKMAVKSHQEQLADYQEEEKASNGIKFPENLPSRDQGLVINNITIHDTPNHAPIGAEMLSDQNRAKRAHRYPDLSGFTGKK